MTDEDKEIQPAEMQGEEQQGDGDQPVTEVEDIEALKEALTEEKGKVEKYFANWQRTQADFSNFKKRIDQEKAESIKFANETLMMSLLPVLDDLDIALKNIAPEAVNSEWVEGITMIHRKLLSTLENHGLCEIEAYGKDFDPGFHEAVCQEEGEEGKVIEEFQKGYMLRDKLLRPCKVKVGKGKEEETGSEATIEESGGKGNEEERDTTG